MDLEKFIERNIVEFLDREISKEVQETPGITREEEMEAFDLAKDYARIVNESLENDDIAKARTTFLELKKEFETFSPGSQNKKKAYEIMVEIHKLMDSYLDKLAQFQGKETPEQIGIILPQKPLSEDEKHTDAIRSVLMQIDQALQNHDVEKAATLYEDVNHMYEKMPAHMLEQKKEIYEEIVRTYNRIRNTHESTEARGSLTQDQILSKLEEVKELVRKKKARDAFVAYRELKTEFAELEAPKEAKEEIFKDILAVYKSIKDLENYIVNKKQRPFPVKLIIKKQSDKDIVKDVSRAKVKAYKYLDKGEIKSAVLQYNTLKELFEKIPGTKKDDKERLYRELLDLHDRIANARGSENSMTEDCWKLTKEINQLLDDHNETEAQRQFLELEHRAINIKDDKEKKELFKALDSIKSRLHLVKAAKNMEERLVEA